jgi:hypothetical protein
MNNGRLGFLRMGEYSDVIVGIDRKCRHNHFSLFPRLAVITSITPIPLKSKAILREIDLGEGMAMTLAYAGR